MKPGRIIVGLLALATLTLALAAGGAMLGVRHFLKDRSALRLEPVFDGWYRADNAALAPAAEPRLVVFGDSRSVELAFTSAPGWQVVNRGIGGESTAQMRYRYAQDVLALRPKAVVLFAGINDLMAAVMLPDRAQAGLAATIANITGFVEEARAAGIEVILLTIVQPTSPRLIRRPIWSNEIYRLVAGANERIEALAGPGVTVIDTNQVLTGGAPQLSWDVARDEIHLNAAGNARLRAAVLAALPRQN